MIRRLVAFAVEQPLFIFLLVGLFVIGGIIAFHDIAVQPPPNEVARFWNEIKPSYRHKEILRSTAKDAMGIGVIEL